tara:strand:+ start:225 stop:866 length:642 start_codon:yes stop_codon:yes gene_type:complete
MKTVIIDYGSGNLHSALKSFQKVANLNKKGDVLLTSDPKLVRVADKIVLPGVGSFNDCLDGLKSNHELFSSLSERVLKKGIPFLGICVGLQLLANYGHENVTNTPGLGWLSGEVKKIYSQNKDIKIPHMGWNSLRFDREHQLTKKLSSQIDMYFVHSYHFELKDINDRLAYVEYSGEITAAVAKDNICGTQFHPEKSQKAGQIFIENFMNWYP